MGGGALVDVVNLHYLVKYNNNINPLDSHYFGKVDSWASVDLRNFQRYLHQFDFSYLDPTVADININLFNLNYLSDIYDVIGKGLVYIFESDFTSYVNKSTIDEKFLILNSDQRWELPSPAKITQGCYRCYNLQLVNLYNHTSLTFACNVCNFHQYSMGYLDKCKDKASVYRTKQYMFYHHLDFDVY